jgi:hypothetical protein
MTEVRAEKGKLYMFVAIDRTSKLPFVQLHERATTAISRDFLRAVIAAVLQKIHTVFTDNEIQFKTPGASGSAVPLINEAIANGEIFRAHACEASEWGQRYPAIDQSWRRAWAEVIPVFTFPE